MSNFSNPSLSLSRTDCVSRGRQNSILTSKNLRSSLYTLQHKRASKPVRLATSKSNQVVVETHQIAFEVRRRMVARYETVHLDSTVVAVGEVEDYAPDCGVGDWRERVAVVGEGGTAAVETEPDHYFEEVCACCCCAEEGVVGDWRGLA